MNLKKFSFVTFLFSFLIFNFSCMFEKTSNKEIVNFLINNTKASISNNNINLTLAFGTDLTNLVAGFQTTGVKVTVNNVEQVSGITPNDFTNPVIYKVIAEDESTKDYRVNVTVAASSDKDLTLFEIPNQATPSNFSNTNISFKMPYNSNLENLVANFNTSGIKVTVNEIEQISGTTANNFTNPVRYKVIAADGSTKEYTVTLSKSLSTEKEITSFNIPNSVSVNINEANSKIDVLMPYDTSLEQLTANFTSTGISVTVDGDEQISGQTINDFSETLIYIVHAADESTKNYSVNVTKELSPLNNITLFIFNNYLESNINQETGEILITMAVGTDPTNLVAIFETTGQVVKVGQTQQISASTSNNFTTPLTYTVTAENGDTKNYTVTVNVILSDQKLITSFTVPDQIGETSINHETGEIFFTMPINTSLESLVPEFETTGQIVKIGETTQTSGVSINNFTSSLIYTVYAENGDTKNYTVSNKSNEKQILTFKLPTQVGETIIDEENKTIEITYLGINPSNLVANFTFLGEKVTVNGVEQTSGQTTNNFSNDLTYTVFAVSGYAENYTVSLNKVNPNIVDESMISKTIKIETIENKTNYKVLHFSILPSSTDDLLSSNYNNFQYCVNKKEYPSINFETNLDLVNYDDFDCEGRWNSYSNIPTSIEMHQGIKYLVNIAIKHDDQIYLYNRLYLHDQIELLSSNITCTELLSKIVSETSIILNSNIDCLNTDITTKNSLKVVLYINGNGYYISNINIDSGNDYIGFIGKIFHNSIISNLTFLNPNVNNLSISTVGILAGKIERSSIENLVIKDATLTGNSVIGSIAGWSYRSNIINSSSNVSVTTKEGRSGLIVGSISSSSIINTKSTGSIEVINSLHDYLGGIAAEAYLTNIINSHSNVNINTNQNSENENIGGLIGLSSGENNIIDSSSKGLITASSKVGGLVGYNSNNLSIINSKSYININALNSVGGLIGETKIPSNGNNVLIQNSEFLGNTITGNNFVGGLVGHSVAIQPMPVDPNDKLHILNSKSSGLISGNEEVGGIIGRAWGNIEIDYTTSNTDVSGNTNVGGFVGHTSFGVSDTRIIKNSISTGDVTGSSDYIGSFGGLISDMDLSSNLALGNVNGVNFVGGFSGATNNVWVNNCYSMGNVTGVDKIGGFIGIMENNTYFTDKIKFSYSTSNVVANTNVGGFIGHNENTNYEILNNYCIQNDNTNGVTQLTQAQFGEQSNFIGFDFDATWVMKDGTGQDFTRPHLRVEE